MRSIRLLDYVIFLLFLVFIVGSILWSSGGKDGVLRAEIEASGELYLLPLTQDGELVLEGPVGETHVEISNGTARITHSDCRDKICIAMGSIQEPSQWIACLPNRVFVRIVAESPTGDEVDAGVF
jgi:hypothetical protein